MSMISKFLFSAIYTFPYFICSVNWDSQKVLLTNRISSPMCIIEVFKMFLFGGNRRMHLLLSVHKGANLTSVTESSISSKINSSISAMINSDLWRAAIRDSRVGVG